MRRAAQFAFGALLGLVPGCVFTVQGGGHEPPVIGQVDVVVLNRPRGEPCAGVPVVSSLGEDTVDTQVTDSAGHASLIVLGSRSDIAAIAGPDDSVAVISVRDGDSIILPALCTPPQPATVTLTVSGVLTRPWGSGEVTAFVPQTNLEIYTTGTAFTATGDVDVSARTRDSYTLLGRIWHQDHSMEVAARSGVALTATAASLVFQPTSPRAFPLSVTNAPSSLTDWVGFAFPLRDDQSLWLSTGGSMTPGSGGTWTSAPHVLGTEIADEMRADAIAFLPGGSAVVLRTVQYDLSAASFDASVLPPILDHYSAFDGTAMSWRITRAGVSTVGIASEFYRDPSNELHYIEAIFPPNLCNAGSCSLTLPPAIRVAHPDNGGLRVLYYWRPTTGPYPDFGELFFGARFPPGRTEVSFNTVEDY